MISAKCSFAAVVVGSVGIVDEVDCVVVIDGVVVGNGGESFVVYDVGEFCCGEDDDDDGGGDDEGIKMWLSLNSVRFNLACVFCILVMLLVVKSSSKVFVQDECCCSSLKVLDESNTVSSSQERCSAMEHDPMELLL